MLCQASSILILVILLVTACSPVEVTSSHDSGKKELPYAEDLQKALDQVLQDGSKEFDLGVSAAVIVPGYETWIGVSGNSHPGEPITSDMLFNVGSVVKSFEAALALKQVENNKLDLDLPLSNWLPEYPNIDSQITVRQLLNHTSGIFNVFEHPDFPWIGPGVDYDKNRQIGETINSFVAEPYGPPAYAQHYSSTNYLLLTEILAQTAGESVPQQVRSAFLEPLSLESSFIGMGELPPANFKVAHPWVDVNLDGKIEDFSGTPYTWIASMTHPVLFTTPRDLAVWMQALYSEEQVLEEAELQEMLDIPKTMLPDPEGGKYGLGIIDFSDILGTYVIGHGGSSLGYSAAVLYLPEYGISLAWAINTGESPRDLANDLMGETWLALSRVIFANQEIAAPN